MSRTATRALVIVVLVILLAAVVGWVSWLTLSGTPKGAKRATAGVLTAADKRNVQPMAVADCVALETAYLQAHPERTDLRVDGNDCNYVRTLSVGGPPGSGPMVSTMSTCQGYWESVSLNVWGFIQVGYIQLAIGACYNGTTTVTRWWGPTCQIVFYPPNMRGWVDYQGYSGSGTSVMTDYCQTQAQIWIAPFGWCCDKYFYYQFDVNYWGDEWWA